jgi:hypothetical protein
MSEETRLVKNYFEHVHFLPIGMPDSPPGRQRQKNGDPVVAEFEEYGL